MNFKDIDTLNKLYSETIIEESDYFDPSAHNEEQAKNELELQLEIARKVMDGWIALVENWLSGYRPEDERDIEALEAAKTGIKTVAEGGSVKVGAPDYNPAAR
jgi:hypothetical protein